jgi:3-oxoacyl-[acyl-carrier protein] reductase
MKIDLEQKIALVTGGAGELGRCICRTLAQCGATVAVHYHTSDKTAKRLVEEIKAAGGSAAAFQADITQESDVFSMRDKVSETLGKPNIIVNNAVIQYKWKTVLEQSLADYDSQYQSCVIQNVLMAKAFVPAMKKNHRGRVIAVNTECAMQCFPTQSAYAAGKRGMDGVLRVLAREIGEFNITVNQVAPGWTISDRDRENRTDDAKHAKTIPLRRRGTDQEVANVVAFLASDLAGFITGAYIPVCGGNVMPGI